MEKLLTKSNFQFFICRLLLVNYVSALILYILLVIGLLEQGPRVLCLMFTYRI